LVECALSEFLNGLQTHPASIDAERSDLGPEWVGRRHEERDLPGGRILTFLPWDCQEEINLAEGTSVALNSPSPLVC